MSAALIVLSLNIAETISVLPCLLNSSALMRGRSTGSIFSSAGTRVKLVPRLIR
jgi:hypothetical protein